MEPSSLPPILPSPSSGRKFAVFNNAFVSTKGREGMLEFLKQMNQSACPRDVQNHTLAKQLSETTFTEYKRCWGELQRFFSFWVTTNQHCFVTISCVPPILFPSSQKASVFSWISNVGMPGLPSETTMGNKSVTLKAILSKFQAPSSPLRVSSRYTQLHSSYTKPCIQRHVRACTPSTAQIVNILIRAISANKTPMCPRQVLQQKNLLTKSLHPCLLCSGAAVQHMPTILFSGARATFSATPQ